MRALTILLAVLLAVFYTLILFLLARVA